MDALAKLVGGSFKHDPNTLREKLSKPAMELVNMAFGLLFVVNRSILIKLSLRFIENIDEIYDMHTHLGGVGHGGTGCAAWGKK